MVSIYFLLDKEKFPQAWQGARNNAEALKNLTNRIQALGWKGLGGWVCAQEAPSLISQTNVQDYWKQRFFDMQYAGFSYWKVDWGEKCENETFRRMLTDMGRINAPKLTIEHAKVESIIPYSDVFRTYDVPALMSIPMTMEKLAKNLFVGKTEEGCQGLINCEDEVYVAAAGGFAMGVMRHPYTGDFVNGKADMSFPSLHRNIKTKMCEVVRAARFHRIAPAFGINNTQTLVSKQTLTDTWRFKNHAAEMESWWFDVPSIAEHMQDNLLSKTAPAAIARGMDLPKVEPDKNGDIPFIVAAKNPCGAYSIVTAGRTRERDYFLPRCDIELTCKNAQTIGVFGAYKTLTLHTQHTHIQSVYMQDLADDKAYDVTALVTLQGGTVVILGELIQTIGTLAQPKEDTSETGVLPH